MKKLFVTSLALISLSLAACGHDPAAVKIDPIKMPAASAPTPAPLTMRDVQWKVLTQADLEALLTELQTNPNPNFALYTLDNGNFQALNLNLVEIRRFILEQQQVVVYFKGIEQDSHPVEEKKEEPKKKFLGLF